MNRFISTFKTDIVVQVRTKLYTIGIVVGALVAIGLSQLALPEQLPAAVPTLMLLVVGGSTLLYVAGMIIFERDEGTLQALISSPLRTSEYLWSKILTLTMLAAVESAVMIGGAMLIMLFSVEIPIPNVVMLLLGIVSIGVIYTLIGIVLIVRYDTITDFLFPMAGIVVVLQLPFIHFLGILEHPAFLVIPTSAPTVLMQGAYRSLATWEWIYGIGYTALWIGLLTAWAQRAFRRHIIEKTG